MNMKNQYVAEKSIRAVTLVVLAILCASCSGVVQSKYEGDHWNVSTSKERGTADLGHYFLPAPFVQVYAYQTRIGSVSNIHYTIRSVVVPDTEHPIALQHNYGMFHDDRLRVTKTPEGLLARVSYRREPKYVDSAVAIAKAVLSVAGPVPLPVKGDDGFSEFSKLVFEQNVPLGDLMGKKQRAQNGQHEHTLVSDHLLNIQAEALFDYPKGGLKKSTRKPSYPTSVLPLEGIYYRPLVPARVTLTERVPKKMVNGCYVTIDTNIQYITNVQSVIIYCPDPRRVDELRFPKPLVAPQSYDVVFGGGTIQEVSVARQSDAFTILKAPLDVIGSVVSLPSGLFTVKVYHNGEESDGFGSKAKFSDGGPKGPGTGVNPREKE